MPEGTNQAGEGGEGTKTGGTAPEPEKPKAAAAPPAPEPKKEPAKAEPPAAKKEPAQLSEDDDDIPENADLIQMSKAALTKRLARHTKKELRERFGTDDLDKIKTDLKELETLRAESEERRRAALSELQKSQEDAKKEKERADKAEKKYQQALDAQTFAEYDRDALDSISTLVAPKHAKRALRELKEHVLTLEEADLKKPKKVFDAWAKEFVKENPEFAKPAPEEPKKVGLTTGGSANAKGTQVKSKTDLTTKTPKPGQANSMSRKEYAEYKRSVGLS
jgi:hypothetical protein